LETPVKRNRPLLPLHAPLPLLPLSPLPLLPLLLLMPIWLGFLGLAGAAPALSAEALLTPPAQLRLDGVAPIPQALARAIGGYAEFRGHRFMDWHPTRREMLINHRGDGDSTAQLHRARSPGGILERITTGSEAISLARFEPVRGDYLLIARGAGGDEAFQIYRHDFGDGRQTLLTDPSQRHAFGGWLRRAGRVLLTAVPLDRTAESGRRESVSTAIWSVDPRAPETRQLIAQLDGAGWWITEVSEDEGFALLTRYTSVSRSEVWLLDLRTRASRRVLPRDGIDTPGAYLAAGLSTDTRWLYFLTDAFGEFRQMARMDLGSEKVERIETELQWDVSNASLSRDGRLLALVYNAGGLRVLRMVSTATLREVPFAQLPPGSVLDVAFHPQGEELMVAMDRPQAPSEVLGVKANGEIESWTRTVVPEGLDASRFAEQQPIVWRSFDGLTISGLIARPSRKHSGRRPVLISIHGGPEAQSTAGFLGRWNYLIEELGVAMIFPNVRGSSGYGKRFLALDNGFLREDAVRDVGALLDWIRDQPDLDPARVAVMGGSYGGYMALATSILFGERIRCAISIVGISHFVTFLERTESYRRDLRRAEYGDERDPAMRRFLDAISPLTQASRIQSPLFVIHGRNDPRVPVSEAEQIVDRLKTSGVPVWYLRADNEGHGFARKENADFQFYAMLVFLKQHLMSTTQPGALR
jgi:dipeptidyl aminopeptidase/acylaminoacyl peptidase